VEKKIVAFDRILKTGHRHPLAAPIDSAKSRYFLLQKTIISQNRESGFSLIEITFVMVIMAILAAISVPSMLRMYSPMRSAAQQVESGLKTVRTRAISSGNAFRIRPAGNNDPSGRAAGKYLVVEYAVNTAGATATPSTINGSVPNCPTSATSAANYNWRQAQLGNDDVRLPNEIEVVQGRNTGQFNWEICFDRQGLATVNTNVTNGITLQNVNGNDRTRWIEVVVTAVGQINTRTYTKDPGSTPTPSPDADVTF
jgi:prepilin-type N-terminal cleavage/methylation domain-containing protein